MSIPRRDDHLVPIVIASMFAVYLLLVAGGLLSALLSGHGLPVHKAPALLTLISHIHNPSLAWRVPVGPPTLYWVSTVVVSVVVIGIPLYVMHLFGSKRRKDVDDPTKLPGLADRRDVRAAAGKKQLLSQGSTIRPSVKRPKPRDLGFLLGESCGVNCYSSYELSIGLAGPPRSGKGGLVIPFILDAPAAVVTTSTKTDNLAVTMIARAKRGQITVVDPEDLTSGGVMSELRWSPSRGCEDPTAAMRRARTLCAGATENVKDGGLWLIETEMVVQNLLHGAALDGRPASDLHAWSSSPPHSREVVRILGESLEAAPLWYRDLDGVVMSEERHREILWSFVRSVFAPLADPKVVAQLTPEPGREFDPIEFLKNDGTLYLLGTASGRMVMENFISALIQDIVDVAYHEAAASISGRLDPPLCLILDEIANYPLKSLSGLASSGGGNGITTVAVVQSLAQLRAQFGIETAGAIWDSMNAKLFLGGSSSVSDLSDIARLIGDRDVTETSITNHGGGRSISETTRQRHILDPSMIRSIPMGYALLLLRNAKPVMLTLKPWTKRKRKEVRELRANKKTVEKMLREGARGNGRNRA